MTSRERINATLAHNEPDKIPLDIGGSGQTGISASVLYQLRRELGLPEKRITICEPFQLLGTVDEDLQEYLGTDIVPLWSRSTLLGSSLDSYIEWEMPDGTPVNMPQPFEYDISEDGDTLVYPQGDRNVKASVKLPKNGFFFDNIDRAETVPEEMMDGRKDFTNLYRLFSDEDATFLEQCCQDLFSNTQCAIHYNFGGGGFGDAAVVPGPYEKEPQGIRKLDEWYMAHYLHPNYIKDVFAYQLEVAIKNLEIVRQAVGDRITSINLSGTDFGSQKSEIISPDHFREFYLENYKTLNQWVHKNTNWKTHFHCCGSIVNILPLFIEAGFDIFNPVQISAENMDASYLKEKYGSHLTFWGGGIDTQHTLPFGTEEEIRREVRQNIETFSPGGGFIFNTIHNIVGNTPVRNILAMLEELQAFNSHTNSGDLR